MYILRKYQNESVNKAVEFFSSKNNKKKRPVIISPTASGKSLIIAEIANKIKEFGDVLILQPSKELLEQNYEKYCSYSNDAKIFSASMGKKEVGRVTFATIGSVVKVPVRFAKVKFVLIDECHLTPPKKDSMYMKFLGYFPDMRILGLTATAFRLKTYTDPFSGEKFSKINLLNRERPKFFNKFLHITQTKELYDLNYLCPVNYISMKWDGSFLEYNSTGAEFSEQSVLEAMKINQINAKIPEILDQAFKKEQKSCLVFVKSVSDAKALSEITPFSDYIHALTKKKDRKKIIEMFRNGSIKTLFNVSVLTTGFDYPELDTVIIARPTMSLALFVQMVGRGIRLAPGKEKCSVLDMCGNLERFGKLEELIIEEDPIEGWVLRNNTEILSGRRLDNKDRIIG